MSEGHVEIDETWAELFPVPENIAISVTASSHSVGLKTRGRASGVPVDSPWGAVYDFRGDEVSRIRTFRDHGEAVRAAGRLAE